MSAWVASVEHIDYLVHAARQYGEENLGFSYYDFTRNERTKCQSNADFTALGQLLLTENQRSVNFRYNEFDAPPQFLPGASSEIPLNPVHVLKLCASLDYQCCETPDWRTTRAFYALLAIKEAAINALPGYDKAPWEI